MTTALMLWTRLRLSEKAANLNGGEEEDGIVNIGGYHHRFLRRGLIFPCQQIKMAMWNQGLGRGEGGGSKVNGDGYKGEV